VLARLAPAHPPAPALLKLTALLRNKETLGAAMVLREVLDRPLCLRGRHR
jgi:hypothetical protein